MTSIPIELLKAPTIVHHTGGDFGPHGGFAEVQDIEFNGEGYIVTALLIEDDESYDWVGETEVQFVVDAGDTVDFGGRGEPVLRAEADVSVMEWQAKFDGTMRAIDALVAKQKRRAEFFRAAVRALGVDDRKASEHMEAAE